MDGVPCVSDIGIWLSGWLESIEECGWPCEALLTSPDVVLLEFRSHCFRALEFDPCPSLFLCLYVPDCPCVTNYSHASVSPIVPVSPITPMSLCPRWSPILIAPVSLSPIVPVSSIVPVSAIAPISRNAQSPQPPCRRGTCFCALSMLSVFLASDALSASSRNTSA